MGSDNTAQYDVVLTTYCSHNTHHHRMELDTQQADLMLQLRQMNITDNRRAAQSYPGPLQRGSDSGFSSDKEEMMESDTEDVQQVQHTQQQVDIPQQQQQQHQQACDHQQLSALREHLTSCQVLKRAQLVPAQNLFV